MSYDQSKEIMGGWTFQRFARNIYKATRTTAPHSITMTGSDVTTQLQIPFPHRILRMHCYHTDSAYAESDIPMAVILRRRVATVTPAKFSEDLFNEDNINVSKMTEVFGEGFEYEAGIYDVILNTTSTHLIFPMFYIQKLEA